MTLRLKSVNRKLFALPLLCLTLLIAIALLFAYGLPELSPLRVFTLSAATANSRMQSSESWSDADLTRRPIPASINTLAPKVKVVSNRITVQGCDLFYREAKPESANPNLTALLLHGMSFTSHTWLETQTLGFLAAAGYRAVAVDLPGFGNTEKTEIADRGRFLLEITKALKLQKPIVISPSYSGHYALPYLLDHWHSMAAYIPVSPVGNEELLKFNCTESAPTDGQIARIPEKLRKHLKKPFPNLDCIRLPTLIVYGQNDRNQKGLESSAVLALLPFSHVFEIPNAGHAAYLNDTPLWHQLLYNFFQLVSDHVSANQSVSD